MSRVTCKERMNSHRHLKPPPPSHESSETQESWARERSRSRRGRGCAGVRGKRASIRGSWCRAAHSRRPGQPPRPELVPPCARPARLRNPFRTAAQRLCIVRDRPAIERPPVEGREAGGEAEAREGHVAVEMIAYLPSGREGRASCRL